MWGNWWKGRKNKIQRKIWNGLLRCKERTLCSMAAKTMNVFYLVSSKIIFDIGRIVFLVAEKIKCFLLHIEKRKRNHVLHDENCEHNLLFNRMGKSTLVTFIQSCCLWKENLNSDGQYQPLLSSNRSFICSKLLTHGFVTARLKYSLRKL
jgi:hypothetical protein